MYSFKIRPTKPARLTRLTNIMYLLIDPSVKDVVRLVLFDESNLKEGNIVASNREFLLAIEKFFSEENFSKENLSGVMVVVGVGGFTSTRIATTIANVFGYVLKIPLLAINQEESKEPQKLISKLREQPIGQYISAVYSGEANIGKKK